MSHEFIIRPMEREMLERGSKHTARKFKKLHYSPTETGSLDVLLMDYFGFVFGYFHIGPDGIVDFQAKIEPDVSIHRKPIPDLIRDIRLKWMDIMQFDKTYAPKSIERTGQESKYWELPIINLELDEE